MKDKIITIILLICLVGGLGTLFYPMLSNLLWEQKQDKILTEYKEEMENLSDQEIEEAQKTAQEYNEKLLSPVVISDPFDPKNVQEMEADYLAALNQQGNGIMAYVEIPRIDVYEPVYHGVSDEVLAKGTGHLENTSLPIGGTGTHAVISGHTGLPNAEIFTKLSSVKKGDVFYVYVLNEVLAYQVDQMKVVEPSDTNDLHIDPKRDYVTLVTCTPYGLNSHRLLVRGTRIPYTPEIEALSEEQKSEGAGIESWKTIYGKSILEGFVVAAIILALIIFYRRTKYRKKRVGKKQ